MELLKKIWPFSYDTTSKVSLIIKAIIYGVVISLFLTMMFLVKNVVVLNVIFYIIGPLIILYGLVGLVLLLLTYFKVLK
ncbi:MAG: hypothetical protein MR270_01390 [Erysipelotrichaceae bacterium]|nr:hypothetical protein [Erysipelotrichaceae bacterium]